MNEKREQICKEIGWYIEKLDYNSLLRLSNYCAYLYTKKDSAK